jgi:DNA-directed RNA polymerase specialized sigma24 family protein
MRVQLINKRPLGDLSSGFFYFKIILCFVLKFEARSSERTWLTAILKNKVIDVYHKKASVRGKMGISVEIKQQTEFFYEEDGHWKEEHWPEPVGIEEYDPLSAKEFQNVLRRCMQKLPPYSYLFLP